MNLTEPVRDAALPHAPGTAPSRIWKYVNELSWRDYFSRVYARIGDLHGSAAAAVRGQDRRAR